MDKLNSNHLLEFFRKLPEDGARRDGQSGGLSTTTVKYYRRILSSILQQGNDQLFTQWNGKPMHPDTICKWLPDFKWRNNLSEVKFHGLRHTTATMLLMMG